MKVSNAGRDLIASFEGLSLTAYLCPAGVWTIGYGHTKDVKPEDRIVNKTKALELLDDDLRTWGEAVWAMIGPAPTSQHEFDAMVSLAFNIGIEGFRKSTVLRLHKAGNREGAARAFSMWNKATVDGKLQVLAGLSRRRAAESAFYLTEDAPRIKAMPQAVEPPPISSKTVVAGGVSVAAGAASVADQIDQVVPIVESITTVGYSLQGILRLGALGLSIIALCAVGYMLWRYIQKRRKGEVIST